MAPGVWHLGHAGDATVVAKLPRDWLVDHGSSFVVAFAVEDDSRNY